MLLKPQTQLSAGLLPIYHQNLLTWPTPNGVLGPQAPQQALEVMQQPQRNHFEEHMCEGFLNKWPWVGQTPAAIVEGISEGKAHLPLNVCHVPSAFWLVKSLGKRRAGQSMGQSQRQPVQPIARPTETACQHDDGQLIMGWLLMRSTCTHVA